MGGQGGVRVKKTGSVRRGPIRQIGGRGVGKSAFYAASSSLPVTFMRMDPPSQGVLCGITPLKRASHAAWFSGFSGVCRN